MEVERFLEEEVDFLAFFAGGVGSSELEVARVFDLRRIRGISSSSDESSKGCFALLACAFDCLVFTMMLLVTMARKRETKDSKQEQKRKKSKAKAQKHGYSIFLFKRLNL